MQIGIDSITLTNPNPKPQTVKFEVIAIRGFPFIVITTPTKHTHTITPPHTMIVSAPFYVFGADN